MQVQLCTRSRSGRARLIRTIRRPVAGTHADEDPCRGAPSGSPHGQSYAIAHRKPVCLGYVRSPHPAWMTVQDTAGTCMEMKALIGMSGRRPLMRWEPDADRDSSVAAEKGTRTLEKRERPGRRPGRSQWRCRESNPGPPSHHQGFSVRSPLRLCSDPPVTRTSRCDDPSRCRCPARSRGRIWR